MTSGTLSLVTLSSLALAAALGAEDGGAGQSADVADVRRSVERSLPFLQKEGVRWIEERKCVSCHQVPFFLWALREADGRGFEVDEAALDGWTRWAIDQVFHEAEQDGRAKAASLNVDTIYQLVLGNRSASQHEESIDALRELLLEAQQEDGSFQAQGQLPGQRRDERETDRVSTLWAALALAPVGDRAERAYCTARDHGGETTEWLATQILARRALESKRRAEPCVSVLLERQNADGGWGWKCGEASDAMATGQALYAIGQRGDPRTRDAVSRAWCFLVETQGEDGSWSVPSTLSSKGGAAAPTSIYWGSAWAVIGLAKSLPAPTAEPGPAPTHYHGRKIAGVMGLKSRRALLRPKREAETRGSLALAALGIRRGSTVCDLGSGNGYFTLDLARLVGPRGKVFAVDVQRPLLDELEERAEGAGLENIEVVLGSATQPGLTDASCDLILIFDAYHEFSHPQPMLRAIRRALRPDGRLAVVEYRSAAEEPKNAKLAAEHTMSRKQILREIPPAGFSLVESFDELPKHHLLIFRRDDAPQDG